MLTFLLFLLVLYILYLVNSCFQNECVSSFHPIIFHPLGKHKRCENKCGTYRLTCTCSPMSKIEFLIYTPKYILFISSIFPYSLSYLVIPFSDIPLLLWAYINQQKDILCFPELFIFTVYTTIFYFIVLTSREFSTYREQKFVPEFQYLKPEKKEKYSIFSLIKWNIIEYLKIFFLY